VQNITDLDDKILKRAEELETSPLELARRYEEKYLHDMNCLELKM